MRKRSYTIDGVVVHGNKIGRTIGFPTININLDKNLRWPKFGIYSAQVIIDEYIDCPYDAVASIGIRPTIIQSSVNVVLEAHIFRDIKEELYGKNVSIKLLDFIRQEEKFNNLEELKLQISNDCDYAQQLLHK